jgi:PKHD-type hydroxylase
MEYALPFDHPLLPNFCEYVVFDGFMPHEVDRIRGLWADDEAERATVSGKDRYNDELRRSSVMFLEPSDSTRWIYERIAGIGCECNAQRFRFELNGFLQPLQLTKYGTGEYFDWHMDFHAGEISHRKLSVTVQLSDPDEYEGGDLQFMVNNRTETAPRGKGSVIVFASFILHRVTEVTAGKRHSIVGWLSGPPYR